MVGSVPLKRLGTVLGPPHPHRSTFNDAIDPKGEHSASHGERPIPEPAIPVEPNPRPKHSQRNEDRGDLVPAAS